MEKGRQAVIYTRVSTTRQADEGVSLDAQLAKGRAWCLAMGYQVSAEFCDAGISGKRADNRPELQAALAAVCASGGTLIVYSLSRLARSTKDAIGMAEKLDRAGADLVSLSEDINTISASGKMIFRLLAVMAEFERDLVGERTRAALAHKRNQGYKTGGAVPFGFSAGPDGRLVECKPEQEAIRLIRALRAKGYTLRDIGGELGRRGILSKKGNTWNPKTIKKILDRAA